MDDKAADSLDTLLARMTVELKDAAILLFQKETVRTWIISTRSYEIYMPQGYFSRWKPLVQLSNYGDRRTVIIKVIDSQMLYPVKVVGEKYLPQLDALQIETAYDKNKLGANMSWHRAHPASALATA